nr:hypothetical protein [uncultured Rhodoferax sp.]
MVRKTKSAAYGVALEKALPPLQPVAFMVGRSRNDVCRLSDQLIAACTSPVKSELEPWQQVQKMQVISTMHLLLRFTQAEGVSADRLFDRDCKLRGGEFKDRGHARKKLKGGGPLLAKTLALVQRRLTELYTKADPGNSEFYLSEERQPRVDVDYRQALWRSLLIECPIADVATSLYCSHDEGGVDPFMFWHKGLLTGDQESFSMCITPGMAGWEYLASCITLLRELSECKEFSLTHQVAKNICLILTMMGIEFQDRGIGLAMLRFCCEHILPIGGIDVEPICIARASALLNTLVLIPSESKELEIDWGLRRYLMTRVVLNLIDLNLQAICDPTKFVNGYPPPAAWKMLRSQKIRISIGRYPSGRWVLDLEGLLATQPQIKAWAGPIAHEPTIPKVWATNKLWDGLGSRGSWS